MTSSLQPARPDPEGGERPAYLPRLPWRWIVIGGTVLGLFAGGYVYRQNEKNDAIRAQVLAAHARIDRTLGQRYRSLRRMVERLVASEASIGEIETYHDPRLRFTPLHRAKGLYLRIPLERARRARDIAAAAREMEPDGITRCLGILPLSLRGLYEKGALLEPEWRRSVERATSEMPLRARDDELANYARRDLPAIARLVAPADYFLLVLEEPPSRRTAPVRVALWDVRHEPQLLLRHRTQGLGLVISARLHLGGRFVAPPPREPAGEMGALDCSIASALKDLTGERTGEVTSITQPPSARQDAGAPDAGTPEHDDAGPSRR